MNTGIALLLNEGHMSRSTGDTAVVKAELDDANDNRGIWLKNITTTQFTEDRSPLTILRGK